MNIWVSSLALAEDMAKREKVHRAISLLGPGTSFPVFEALDPAHHHRVEVDDIGEFAEGYETPAGTHVAPLIDFLSGWDPITPMLIHCYAGISRSTASAFIASCLHNPDTEESVIAEAIAKASPTAFPNTLIVAIADQILNRNGRMVEAIDRICTNAERKSRMGRTFEAEPFSIPSRL